MAATRPSVGDSQKRLGELLVELGFIDEPQLQTALARQRQWGKRLGWVLVESGFITEARLVRGLSRQLKLDTCDPIAAPVHDRVRALIPRDMALDLRVVPIAIRRDGDEDVFFVATSDPLNHATEERIARHTKMRVQFLLAGDTEIDLALARHYGTRPPSFAPDEPVEPVTATRDMPAQLATNDVLAHVVALSEALPEATIAMATGEPPVDPSEAPPIAPADQWPEEDVTVADFDDAPSEPAAPFSGLPPPHVAPGPIFGGSAAGESEGDSANWADMMPGSSEHVLPPSGHVPSPSPFDPGDLGGAPPNSDRPFYSPPREASVPPEAPADFDIPIEPVFPEAEGSLEVDIDEVELPVPEMVPDEEPVMELGPELELPPVSGEPEILPRPGSIELDIEEALGEIDSEIVANPTPVSSDIVDVGGQSTNAREALERFVKGRPLNQAEGMWVARLIAAIFVEEGLLDDERLERAVARVGPLEPQ